MKVLIIGNEGTPYSNGAFQFDVFFHNQYPNSPPKVTLMTKGWDPPGSTPIYMLMEKPVLDC